MSTQDKIAAAFEALRGALEGPKGYGLPETFNGRYRRATAAEFMLMDFAGEVARFKHRETRNYLYLYPAGRVVVPFDRADPFFGGFYGPAPAADLGSATTP